MSRSKYKTLIVSGRKTRVKFGEHGWTVLDKPRKPPLRALTRNASRNQYQYGPINPALLERFACPKVKTNGVGYPVVLSITVPEFTSLCPVTDQPDFAALKIDYTANNWCVESKSLKLYLMSFRQSGAFHEQCLVTICNDLVTLLNPRTMIVAGTFGARGGIAFNPTVSYYANESQLTK